MRETVSLPKNVSIGTALGTAALVGGIHAQFTPSQADMRVLTPGTLGHSDVSKSRRQATWLSAAFVGAIYLLTKDETTLIIGGAAVVGFDVMSRYNAEIFPGTGRIENPDAVQQVLTENADKDAAVVQMAPYQNVM